MKAEEIREMDDDSLRSRIAQLEEERFRLRFRSASEALEEPLLLRSLRRDIARLQTIVRERTLGIVRATSASAPARGTKRKTAKKAAAKKASRPAAANRK